MPTCGSSYAQLAVRGQLYLVSIRITAFSEPQPQELFVNALWLLVLCMPSFIRLLYPVPACSPTTEKKIPHLLASNWIKAKCYTGPPMVQPTASSKDFGHGDGRYGSAAIDDNGDVLSFQEVLSSLRGGPLKVGRRGLVLAECTNALQQAQHGGGRLQAGQCSSNILLGTLSLTLYALQEQQSSTARRYVCFCYARTVHRRESNPQAIKPGIACKCGFYWGAYVLVWLLTRNGCDGAPHIFESPTVISPARRRKSAHFPVSKMNQQY